MGFSTTDFSNSKIIGTPGSEKIRKETQGRFLIKRDEITELQAPYLSEEESESFLAAYRVNGWKDMFAGGNSQKTGRTVEELTRKIENLGLVFI